ncbi:MAG: hypothetical protein FWC70_10435 [Defluviitaleaceae bacterium]|nr:hypothetical protein [Defluviitaleaceae bacterium]
MTINSYPTGLAGNYYTRIPAAPENRYDSDAPPATEQRSYSSDAAVTAYSANGDVLELSSGSIANFQAFGASSDVDFDSILAQLQQNAPHLVNAFTNMRNNIQNAQSGIASNQAVLRDFQEGLVNANEQLDAFIQILYDLEARIDSEEEALLRLDDQEGFINDAIAIEEDRLGVIADRLEDRLENQLDRLYIRHERLEDRFNASLARRLARLERIDTRFTNRQDLLRTNETERRRLAEERIAEMIPGSPEYNAARLAEDRRVDRFETAHQRRYDRHERRMTRAQARHDRWYDRWTNDDTGRLARMENTRAARSDANDARVEAARTQSRAMTSLNAQLQILEDTRTETENRLMELSAEFDRLEADPIREAELLRLENEVSSYEGAIERMMTETLPAQQANLNNLQTSLENTMEGWRRNGFIV